MKETYKYGAVYWRYGSKGWEDGETLEDVVDTLGYGSDNGDLAYNEDDFYELTNEGWVSIDREIIQNLFDERDARERDRYKKYDTKRKEQPWQLRIVYPQNTEQIWNRFETREEAEAEQANLDPRLDTIIVRHGEKDLW